MIRWANTYFLILIFIIIGNGLSLAQSNQLKSFVFIDSIGNTMEIENFKSFPNFLDSVFWKRELIDNPFRIKKDKQFTYVITVCEKVKNKKEYLLCVNTKQKSNKTIEEAINISGRSKYKMILKKGKDGVFHISSMTFLFSEI
jgi:hypothetical protein